MTLSEWEIPCLCPDRLATTIPSCVYGGGVVSDSDHSLFLWRTVATQKAAKGMLAFYLDDERLEAIWRAPERYAQQFKHCGIRATVEVDFSLWRDRPLAEQLFNVYRTRTVSRIFQGYGLSVLPNLNWASERSFSFAFEGIPVGCPIAMTECRTPGGNDSDRRAFLKGLTEGVKQIQPGHVCIYGGKEHAFWLTGNLPSGPQYTLLESWTTARGRIRATQERHVRERNQFNLFIGGESQWVDEEAPAEESNDAAAKTRDRHEARQGIHAASNSRPCRSHNQRTRSNPTTL